MKEEEASAASGKESRSNYLCMRYPFFMHFFDILPRDNDAIIKDLADTTRMQDRDHSISPRQISS